MESISNAETTAEKSAPISNAEENPNNAEDTETTSGKSEQAIYVELHDYLSEGGYPAGATKHV